MSDLVVISLESWDEIWRRNQYLIGGLLKADPTMRVLFVEPSVDPLHLVRSRRGPSRGRGLRVGPPDAAAPGRLQLFEDTKWLPRRLDRNGDRRWAQRVVRAAATLRLTDPILWVNDPRGAVVLERSGWRALYDVTDDWTLAERTTREIRRLVDAEALLLERCDEVVVCSPDLARSKGAYRAVTLVPNAVDVARYVATTARPPDFPSQNCAVYVGTLHRDRIDVALCVETAGRLGRDGRLVLVGPNLLDREDSDRLQSAGVALLGSRDRLAVPAYLQHAKVLVVPHVVTAFTDSLDPIKLYEYRAVGRPVVSTPVAGFRDTTDPRVTVASRSDFAAAVQQAMAGVDGTAPLEGPPAPDWADRVRSMSAVLGRMTARASGGDL